MTTVGVGIKRRVNKKISSLKNDNNDTDSSKNVTFAVTRNAHAENLAKCTAILKSRKYVPAFEMNRNEF